MKKILFLFWLAQLVVSAFSQNVVSLDTGISRGVKQFEGRIEKGTKLVILNFRAPSPQLSEYIREELTFHLINSSHFRGSVVDRSNLDTRQKEMAFQLSGEVSDETIQSLGKILGAQIIFSGAIEPFGDIFRLIIQAIAVESGLVKDVFRINIQKDRFLTSLLGTSDSSGNMQQNANSQPPQTGTTTPSQETQRGNTGSRVRLPDYLLSN